MNDEVKASVAFMGNHQVRFLEINGGAYVPITDIAKATGIRKRSLLKVMDNAQDIFSPHERDALGETPGGIQRMRCIDSDGAHLLLTRINNHHIKNQDTRAKLLEFNDMIRDRAAGKIVSVPALPAAKEPDKRKPDFDHILAELTFVKRLAKETGWDLNELRVAVLRDHSLYSLASVGEKTKPAGAVQAGLLLPQLPAPPSLKPKGYFNATDIGEFAGRTAKEINQWLYNQGYIMHDDENEGEWRITDLGREFGEERSYNPPNSLKLVWRCYWKPTLLPKMNINPKPLIGSEG